MALIAEKLLVEQSAHKDLSADRALKTIHTILGNTKIDEAATWPDEVKSQARSCNGSKSKSGAEAGVYVRDPDYGKRTKKGKSSALCDAYAHTSNWHFINTYGSEYVLDPDRKDYHKGDLVVLVEGLVHVLKGEPSPVLDGVTSYSQWKERCENKPGRLCKKEALEFLIHLVGDIHQPLHSGASCDTGGNSQYITFFGGTQDPNAFWCKDTDPVSCRNYELHQAWDTNLLVHSPRKSSFVSVESYASKLVSGMKGRITGSDATQCVSVAPGALINVDGGNGPAAWVKESLCYIKQVYSFPDDISLSSGAGGEVPNRCVADRRVGSGRDQGYKAFSVGDKYYEINIATINERLYWGGARLAMLLKDIYGAGDKVDSF